MNLQAKGGARFNAAAMAGGGRTGLIVVLALFLVGFGLQGKDVEEPGRKKPSATLVLLLGASARELEGEQKVRGAGERLLKRPLVTVVEKKHLAASGDRHDYASIGIYWWPNPVTQGLPYVRRDGEVNPESREYDSPRLEEFSKVVLRLALEYGRTGDVRFAERARSWLRAWFVDGKTLMNPHLVYAQAWPGLRTGAPYGVIEGVVMAESVPAAIMLLREYGGMPEEEWEAISRWFAAYSLWFETSEHGRAIDAGKHNISTWYDVQRLSFALLLGEGAKAAEIAREAVEKRLGMITPEGEFPEELRRARSWDYCCYHLRALMRLAELAEGGGVDLWRAKGASGGSIRAVVDFMLPYALQEREWHYPQEGVFRPRLFLPLLEKAAKVYGSPVYREALARM